MAWYRTRARIGTVYGLAGGPLAEAKVDFLISQSLATELHQLSPTVAALAPEARLPATLKLVDSLLAGSDAITQKVKDAEEFGTFVVRSWMGIGRSLGL